MRPADRPPFLTPLLAVSAVTIHLLPLDVAAALQFDRPALAGGEFWRLVTAHLTHFGPSHLAWDVGVLFGLGWFCERNSRRQTAVALALATAAISLAIWLLLPGFQVYRGLSGLDCALFGLLAMRRLQHPAAAAKLAGAAALLALLAKSGWETLAGTTMFVADGDFIPVPLAHLVGALCGVVAGLGRREDGSVQLSAFSSQHSEFSAVDVKLELGTFPHPVPALIRNEAQREPEQTHRVAAFLRRRRRSVAKVSRPTADR